MERAKLALLMPTTALSSTVGTGNAGVATAIGIVGPALFGCGVLLGLATKYSEAVLAVNFRETDKQRQKVGGPIMEMVWQTLDAAWGYVFIW